MRKAFHTFGNKNARWKFTHHPVFQLGLGCLGLVFILLCIGALLLVNTLPLK